ncbi:protein SENSITIVE TO UV 2 [Benincasa hispida]|uniref:protein SENSITIVE TO UV 2 n=1 Tax=Benincasa hispida TaxID=102211 RepID=UPI00190116DA|nr:protein SENSITIVE TO UV 2 [Benincasa hispida]
METEDEGFEDWDADFLDQLIQVEELAISSTANNHIPIPISIPSSSSTYFPLPPPQPEPEPQPQHLVEVFHDRPISYSPPRELSQRATGLRSHAIRLPNGFGEYGPSSSALAPCLHRPDAAKELEIYDLKRELGRVSKQLKDLEQECVELRKKRDKNEEQLKVVSSNKDEQYIGRCVSESTDLRVAGKDGGRTGMKSEDIAGDLGGPHTVTSRRKANEQVGKAHSSVGERANDDLPAFDKLSKKLQVFWVPESDSKIGQNLVSELLLSCETDFRVLFHSISTELSPKFSVDFLGGDNSSDIVQFLRCPEAKKVSNLYTTLTKVSNGIVKMEALFTPLLDLCNLDNVAIVHRSLHILHMFLKRLLWLERKSERRETVMIGGLGSRNNAVDSHGSQSAEGEEFALANMDKTSHGSCAPAGTRLPGAALLCKNRNLNKNINLVPQINWVAFFEVMHQVAKRHSAKCVRIEAVSVMNLILMRNNTYLEKEKFGQALLFDSVVEFIRKESGSAIQKHGVRLLFLILNCPTFFVVFCSGCKEAEATDAAEENVRCAGGFQKFRTILHSLADCLTCCGNGIEELKLRRNTILLLAFLASSGKVGFEILISNKLYTESNFLALILQVTASEVEQEKTVPEPVENLEERALLLREVLILLNRLASHSLYSGTVLRVLTNSRDMASLAIDVTNKLCRKNNRNWQFDSKKRKMRETEVVELAQVFRKRLLSYLGNNIL